LKIKLKRIYEAPSDDDGIRIMVDRLWPRGISKKDARIDHWFRDVAPSTELRRWFDHKSERWTEFKRRFFAELKEQEDLVRTIRDMATGGTVTLIFAAKNTAKNNAVALREHLVHVDEAN
jgi:uncharacterized protein YeaO (DUF488 family)